jgi:flagellar M-ring protein FliF
VPAPGPVEVGVDVVGAGGELAVPVEVLAMPPELAARSLQNGTTITPEMLNELIKQKPANIGTALRDWAGSPATAAKN